MTRFRRLALAATIATLALVSLGGLVRATGSGLGCLDAWPSCRGGWTAPGDYKGLIEYSHRALAAIALALVVALVVFAHRERVPRALRRWSYAAAVPFFVQAGLGGLVVKSDLHAALVTAHLLAALFLVFAVVRVATGAYLAGRGPATDGKVARSSAGALAGLVLVLVAGAYVREKGAGLAFPDWPLMGGRLIPPLDGLVPVVHFAHRLLAAVVFGHLLAMWLRARRDPRPPVRALSLAALAGYTGQILAGAANVWTGLSPAAVVSHVTLGSLTWASVAALTVAARADGPVHAPGTLRAYVQLTKPRIVLLLLITTVPAMVLAAGGLPSGWLVAATLLGGTLASGGANAINQYLDRDIDKKMRRTSGRPLPSERVVPRRALRFGIGLGIVAFVWLTFAVNLLSAALSMAALLFYVFVYTVWLKRTTTQNIVIGGAAGAVPCLVGWAAVTGTLAWPAWVMFAIVFLWTPPHFWALAVRFREDYAEAGVPMLPVVRGVGRTAVEIVVYSFVLVAATVVLYPVARMGALYLAAALVLGAVFVYRALRLWRAPNGTEALGLFKYSVVYLALLFFAIGADRLLA